MYSKTNYLSNDMYSQSEIRSVEYLVVDREYSISQRFYTQLIEYLPLTEYSIHQVTSSDQEFTHIYLTDCIIDCHY